MKRITLPLVMIASLATLVSCGEKTTTLPTPIVQTENPAVTGVVVTPPAPVVITRKEILSYAVPAPGTADKIEFDVTVTDGVITRAAAVSMADHEYSKNWQSKFVAELSLKVVGKKAKDLKVDAIGGASLATAAFETFVHSF
jgi:uncharacterized protein with FMN-binding domain